MGFFKRTSNLSIIIAIFIALCLVVNTEAQDVSAPQEQPAQFERISTADGLSFPIVQAIIQDYQGFMWFGTEGGLNKYDGRQFTVYTHDYNDPTTIRYDSIRALFEDSDHTLWIGGAGGLDRFDRATETFTHIDTRGQVNAIYEDHEGILWVGFWHGLYGYDRSTGEVKQSYQSSPSSSLRRLSNSNVMAIQEDQQGNLWIGTLDGLDKLNRSTGLITHYPDPKIPGEYVVNSLYADRLGNLWVGTGSSGILKLALNSQMVGGDYLTDASGNDKVKFTRFQHDPDDPNSLSSNQVSSILEDSKGILWVSTLEGLNQYDPVQNRFSHQRYEPNNPLSLSDNVVFTIYEDRSGVLWVATANGLSKHIHRASLFSYYRKQPDLPTDASDPMNDFQWSGLSDGKVLEIYEDSNETVWVGTIFGGLNRWDQDTGGFTVFQHDPADPTSLSDNYVEAIYEDRDGVLWVGTGNGWLEQFDPETETFNHSKYLGETSIRDIVEDPAGNLWIGTFGESLYRLDPNRTTLIHYVNYWQQPNHWKQFGSLSHNIINTIAIDQEGVPWIGTYAGGINIWQSDDDKFTHHRHDTDDPNSLSHEKIYSILEQTTSGGSVVWIGTGGGGLNRFDPNSQTFTQYTQKDGLIDDTITCILADDTGYLWLSTPKGLTRFDPETETFRHYDNRDGVIGGLSLPGGCAKRQNGQMLFSSADGFYDFYPEQIVDNQSPPSVVITAVELFNQTLKTDPSADEQLEFSYKDNYLSFEFAALDYTIPEKNQYAYMMEGLDEDWILAGTRQRADYPNLQPGSYVFRVKGSNNDGIWNEEGTAIRISITPPFWETWIFRGFIAFLLIGIATATYRQRVNSIKTRSLELEQQVAERTAELKQEVEQRIKTEEALRQSEMDKAVAAERSRLARELHDSVTQSLYSLTLLSEAGQRLANTGELDRIKELLSRLGDIGQQALKEMRLLVYQLRPLALENEGLVGAIQQRLDAVERRAGVDARLMMEDEIELPAAVEEELFRIAQEALNNALKHANSTATTVTLCDTSLPEGRHRVMLEVKDNGKGFDPAKLVDEGGMGLTTMSERAEKIGGSYELISSPEKGTIIRVSVEVSS